MKKLSWKMLAVILAVFVLGLLLAWVGPLTPFRTYNSSAAPVSFSQDTVSGIYEQDTVTGIYEQASPAVVQINTTENTGMRGFFSQGEGSGFLVDTNGDIMTNNHVVDGATNLKVVFKDGKTVDATVVGTDSVHDLAVVKVDPSAVAGITPLQFADSSQLKPGQMAIALGAPYGLTDSITVGVVSGLDRTLSADSFTGESLSGMVQTDAAINPGNSGGPLLDSNGQVIGINTAIQVQAGGGIGFAVASNVANNALPNLLSGKQVQRVWLGISGMAITPDLAQQLNLTVNQGVYVIDVVSGSPADKAGLKGSGVGPEGDPASGGDVITAVDGNVVKSVPDLTNYFAGKQVGDQVSLTVMRGSSTNEVKATLSAWPTQSNPGSNQMPSIPWPWGQRVPIPGQ